jgi:hypothetical protein
MFRRFAVALVSIPLLLPLSVMAQKSGQSSFGSAEKAAPAVIRVI